MYENEEDDLICRNEICAVVLAHATQMAANILDETGGDQKVLEDSTVTLSCEFVLDTFDLLLEYALRYEGEVFGEIHEELIDQYKMMASRKSGFGSMTKH